MEAGDPRRPKYLRVFALFRIMEWIWPYIAGLFDGDGWIWVNKERKKIEFGICSSSLDALTRLKEMVGKGTIRRGHRVWEWRITGRYDVFFILNKIKDYVMIKREKVLEAINFLAGLLGPEPPEGH